MKYLRFISNDNVTCQGFLEGDAIRLVQGDILGEYVVTEQKCGLDDIREYLPPVERVPNVLAIGKNYSEHAKEFGGDVPDSPLLFIKATTTLNAHQQPIVLPLEAPCEVDYEAELAIVIGKTAKHVPQDKVDDYIFGYTCANDVTARDCQRSDKQWARGKSFDSFCPLGPVVETELDTADLHITTKVNGQVLQDGRTSDMIFGVRELVSYLSRSLTLLAGTVILTGTPSGVGFARDPQIFLRDGDVVCVEIEGIGKLENKVVTELV